MQNEKIVSDGCMPSIGQVLRCYRTIAAAERMKTGRPGENTVANAIRGTRCVCRAAGVSLETPVSRLTRQTLDAALSEFVRRGHADIWRRIDECGGPSAFDVTDETFDGINRDLRDLGFSGSKASYELRKICIDHIYQRFGAEKAVSISGDDIRTISRYYADPSQPNIGAVRVMDLIG